MLAPSPASSLLYFSFPLYWLVSFPSSLTRGNPVGSVEPCEVLETRTKLVEGSNLQNLDLPESAARTSSIRNKTVHTNPFVQLGTNTGSPLPRNTFQCRAIILLDTTAIFESGVDAHFTQDRPPLVVYVNHSRIVALMAQLVWRHSCGA